MTEQRPRIVGHGRLFIAPKNAELIGFEADGVPVTADEDGAGRDD